MGWRWVGQGGMRSRVEVGWFGRELAGSSLSLGHQHFSRMSLILERFRCVKQTEMGVADWFLRNNPASPPPRPPYPSNHFYWMALC